MKIDRRTITVGSGRTKETMDTYGHSPMPEPDYSIPFPECCPEPVPHEQIDTDDLRKRENNHRHSSYRK